MWITLNYLLAIALVGFLIKRIEPRPKDFLSPNWPNLRKALKQCSHLLDGTEVLLEWGPSDPCKRPLHNFGEKTAYRTLGELLQWLARITPKDPEDYRKIIQALYLFEANTGVSGSPLAKQIRVIAAEMEKLTLFGKPIDRTELIEIGAPVNLKQMQPLAPGTVVVQPLGVAVYSEGKIIYKAPVLCR